MKILVLSMWIDKHFANPLQHFDEQMTTIQYIHSTCALPYLLSISIDSRILIHLDFKKVFFLEWKKDRFSKNTNQAHTDTMKINVIF